MLPTRLSQFLRAAVLTALLVVAGCQTAPVQEMSDARQAITVAREAGAEEHAADDLNRRAVRALQADGRVFVSGTVWAGRAAIRAAFDNWMTGTHDVAILKQAVAEVRDRPPA